MLYTQRLGYQWYLVPLLNNERDWDIQMLINDKYSATPVQKAPHIARRDQIGLRWAE